VTTGVELIPGKITTRDIPTVSSSNYTESILYIRSRNIEFDSNSLKPVTRFHPFFSQINISDFIIPKLLEIEMISGVFQVGETVESDATFIQNKIRFRLCTPNHRTGPYNGFFIDTPTTPDFLIPSLSFIPAVQPNEDVYKFNPYTQQPMPESYSESSTFLNVDTKSLSLPSETAFYGCVSVGMTLIGKSSGAVARVSNVRLISDRNGRLIGSFFIPDPNQFGNLKFVNGVNVFTLIDVDSLNLITESESFSESNYTSSGNLNVTETNILTTRNVNITFPYLVSTVGEVKTTVTTTSTPPTTPTTTTTTTTTRATRR
jgi:hypothetical protein